MSIINTQIILFGPHFYLEKELLFFLTHKEKVSYRFNENCWITYLFARLFHLFRVRQPNITAITIINPPKLFSHPTLGLYSFLTASISTGRKNSSFPQTIIGYLTPRKLDYKTKNEC